MGKLNNVKGNVSMTLDKLSEIRGDLVCSDPEWQTWDCVQLTEALNQWVRRNPVTNSPRNWEEFKRKNFSVPRTTVPGHEVGFTMGI